MNNIIIPVSFHGDTLSLIDHDGEPYVAMKPVVEAIGLDWKSQFDKIKGRYATCVVEITTQALGDDQRRAMTCLPLRKLTSWLMGIYPNKVDADLREKIIAYQEECDDALWDYWSKGKAERAPPADPVVPRTVGPVAFPVPPRTLPMQVQMAIRYRVDQLRDSFVKLVEHEISAGLLQVMDHNRYATPEHLKDRALAFNVTSFNCSWNPGQMDVWSSLTAPQRRLLVSFEGLTAIQRDELLDDLAEVDRRNQQTYAAVRGRREH